MSTLSHDGRMRWDGRQWVPAQGVPAYSPAIATHPRREPTPWTRPLQLSIAAYYALVGLYTLSLPFTMGGVATQSLNASLQRQQSLNPQPTPLPAGFGDALTSMMTFILVVTAIFGFAIAAVGFVAALRRWTWAYYAILVLFGLGILSLLYSVLSLVASSAASSLYGGFSLPGWTYVVSIATGLIDIGLFTWMLIALTRYGPWAMRKVN